MSDGKWHHNDTLERVTEIPKKEGKGMTSRITVKRARELGLLRSVTSKISDVKGDGFSLVQWKNDNCILAAHEHAMEAGEEWEAYCARMRGIASEISSEARDRGGALHSMLEDFIKQGGLPSDPAGVTLCKKADEFLSTCECEGIHSEKTLVFGSTCGTPDLFVEKANLHKVCAFCDVPIPEGLSEYGELITDLKTKDFHEGRKVPVYEETYLQLGAYATAKDIGTNALFLVLQCDRKTGDTRFVLIPETEKWATAWTCLNAFWEVTRDWNAEAETSERSGDSSPAPCSAPDPADSIPPWPCQQLHGGRPPYIYL